MKNKFDRVCKVLAEHEGKILFALWILIIMTGCGIMGITIINDIIR